MEKVQNVGTKSTFTPIIYIRNILCILLHIFKYIHTYGWGYKIVYNNDQPKLAKELDV